MSVAVSFYLNFDSDLMLWSQNNIITLKKKHIKHKFPHCFYKGKYFVLFFPPLAGFSTLEMETHLEYHFSPTFGEILSNKTVISVSLLPTYSLYLFEAES